MSTNHEEGKLEAYRDVLNMLKEELRGEISTSRSLNSIATLMLIKKKVTCQIKYYENKGETHDKEEIIKRLNEIRTPQPMEGLEICLRCEETEDAILYLVRELKGETHD